MEKTPWGFNEVLAHGHNFLVQIFKVKEGQRTSLHLHEAKGTFWIIESGNAEVVLEEQVYFLGAGDTAYIDAGQIHRLSALVDDVVVFEVMTGEVDDIDDVVRFEDDYGRVSEGME